MVFLKYFTEKEEAVKMKTKLPEGWKEVELKDIIECVENGNRPKGGVGSLKEGIPSIGGEHINKNGGYNFSNIKFISKEFFDSQKRGIIRQGDVLVVKDGATTGRVALVSKEKFPYNEALVNEHVFILRPKNSIIASKFLFYYLYSAEGQKKILYNFHGSAQGGINTQFVKNVEFFLSPLPTQQKIVSILEKAEKVKELRKEAYDLTKDFLKAVFMEMFGDRKKFETKKLKELCSLITKGTTPTTYGHPFIDRGINFLKIENIEEDGNILLDSLKFISKETHNLLKRSQLNEGDLIFSIAGALGRVTIIKKEHLPANINQAIAIIRLKSDKEINRKYLEYYLRSDIVIAQVTENKRGVAQLNLNLEQIGNLKIIYPSLPLQQKFASIVKEVEQLKEQQKHSKEQLDSLFNALMQKAFKGELVA